MIKMGKRNATLVFSLNDDYIGSELSDRPHARTYVDIGVPKIANFLNNLLERNIH